jgi:hypothetical protein
VTEGLRYRRSWLAGGWALIAFVIVICMLPAPVIAPIARFLPDKLEHAIAYFVLTLWFSGLYPKGSLWWIALALVLMGCAIEIAQGTFTSTRQMDVNDALANFVGVAVALVLALAGASRWPYGVEALLKRRAF